MKSVSFFLALFSFLGVSSVFAAAPDPSVYPYQREIEIPSQAVGSQVKVVLSPQAVSAVKPDLSNLQLLDQENNPVDFSAFTGKSGKYLEGSVRISDVSSGKGSDSTLNLSDNDPLTSYEFDEKVDGTDASWVLFDFSRPVPLNRLVVYTPTDQQTIRTFEIEAGLSEENLKTVKARGPLEQTTDFFDPITARYIKVNFWGSQVKIWDINFFVSPEVELYFTPEQQNGYKLLYGNPDIKSIRYKQRRNKPFPAEFEAQALRESSNPLFQEDIDGDGISNGADNCIFISNPKQEDTDKDRVGDVCDNAPENQNRSQIDTDRDSIGDIIDNCKLKQNIDQKDRDKDGIGDICDEANDKKVEITNKNKPYFFYGLLIILILGIVGLVVHEKFFKKEEKSA